MIAAIVQARMGSTRLPGKTLAHVAGKPMLARLVERARRIPGVERVIIATSEKPADQAILQFATDHGLPAYAGSEEDVLDRFCRAARRFGVSVVVRVTPDCPLLDPAVSGLVVDRFVEARGTVDYASNVNPPTYPDGLDTEVFSRAALERAWREVVRPPDREHVTTYIRDHPDRFRVANVANGEDLSAHRWVVDTEADLAFVRQVYAALDPAGTRIFGMAEVLELLSQRPELRSLNAGIRRNEGLERSRARDLVVDAKRARGRLDT